LTTPDTSPAAGDDDERGEELVSFDDLVAALRIRAGTCAEASADKLRAQQR
jgi:hypothetical protein